MKLYINPKTRELVDFVPKTKNLFIEKVSVKRNCINVISFWDKKDLILKYKNLSKRFLNIFIPKKFNIFLEEKYFNFFLSDNGDLVILSQKDKIETIFNFILSSFKKKRIFFFLNNDSYIIKIKGVKEKDISKIPIDVQKFDEVEVKKKDTKYLSYKVILRESSKSSL